MSLTNGFLAGLLITMAVTTVFAAEARQQADQAVVQGDPKANEVFRPVIEFGHGGGNLRPYKIGIDANGQVRILDGSPQLKTQSIPVEKVAEFLKEAVNKEFWRSSSVEDRKAQNVLPDFGFVFVRVRVPGHSRRIIYRHGPQAGPLGRFYAQLSDLVLTQP